MPRRTRHQPRESIYLVVKEVRKTNAYERAYLMHYGRKGMRWGVIRTPAELGHYVVAKIKAIGKPKSSEKKEEDPPAKKPASAAASPPAKKEYRTDKLTKDSMKTMSMQELKSVVERLDWEKKFTDHMDRLHPKKEHKIRRFLGDLLKESGKKLVADAVKEYSKGLFSGGQQKEAQKNTQGSSPKPKTQKEQNAPKESKSSGGAAAAAKSFVSSFLSYSVTRPDNDLRNSGRTFVESFFTDE